MMKLLETMFYAFMEIFPAISILLGYLITKAIKRKK